MGYFHDLINPFWRASLPGFLLPDPFSCRGDVVESGRVPGYTGDYEVSVFPVRWVEAYSQCREALPLLLF